MNAAFFLFSLLLLWVVTTSASSLGHQLVATSAGGGDGNGVIMNKKCIDKERHALLDFKANLQDPNGIGCLSTWRVEEEEEGDDCCKWSGITCNNQTGHVTNLTFGICGLEGEVSPSLLNLTYLIHLDLSGNSFTGTIPIFIGSLSELRYLGLSGNSFYGTIPWSIGNLTQLTYLNLSSNNFNGNIPKSIGSLTDLTDLDLTSNDFVGSIPSEFGNLTNMQYLQLRGLSSCTIENIDWLSHMSHLKSLDMSGISLAKATNWVNVILGLQELLYLFLIECELSQVMHPYFSSYSSLNSSSSSSSNIVSLVLRNNNLNSSVYNWLFPLTSNKLQYLELSENMLDGIPKYFGNLCSLETLGLGGNSVVVRFPDFLNNLSGCTSLTLQVLNASSSKFTGSLSDEIQKFSSLRYLNLSRNQLIGTVSEKVWELPMLIELDLSSNNFRGPIPNVPSTLIRLDLSNNKFYGEISFPCHTVNGSLVFLDLSNNSLAGRIPDCLRNFKKLRVLNLGNNNLSGRIPASVGSLIELEVLYLFHNSFSGELPLSLANCKELTFLNLGENMFSGNVPVWIGENLSGLYALSLRSNHFFGPIPLQICQLENLQILDLSMNNLYGTIPSCVNNLTSMVQEGFLPTKSIHKFECTLSILYNVYFTSPAYVDYAMIQWQGSVREFRSINLGLLRSIDLSRNNLTGQIPYEITSLHKLHALYLSKNALVGEIPQKIGQMKELQILDISRNNLSGGIPSSMSHMSFLNYLDVSHNNLSGRIPSGTQLQTFDPSRYIGNAGLCGLPLSKYCPGDEKLQLPPVVVEVEDDGESINELWRWFYIGGATGFPIGFWIMCSALLLNRRGRYVFFKFLDSLQDWVYVKLVVFVAKFSRITDP